MDLVISDDKKFKKYFHGEMNTYVKKQQIMYSWKIEMLLLQFDHSIYMHVLFLRGRKLYSYHSMYMLYTLWTKKMLSFFSMNTCQIG